MSSILAFYDLFWNKNIWNLDSWESSKHSVAETAIEMHQIHWRTGLGGMILHPSLRFPGSQDLGSVLFLIRQYCLLWFFFLTGCSYLQKHPIIFSNKLFLFSQFFFLHHRWITRSVVFCFCSETKKVTCDYITLTILQKPL